MSTAPDRPSAAVTAAIAQLRRAGHRITTARRAVLEAIAGFEHHPTADEIQEAVAGRHPDVHLATVYRTLETLRGEGIVEHTHLRHGPAVYRLVGDDHEHAVCEVCGAVTDLPSALLAGLRRRLAREYGFRVGAQHFAITGRCRRCG